jgi:hypothetical protein
VLAVKRASTRVDADLAWALPACQADGLRRRDLPLMQSANRPVEGERAARDEKERQQHEVPGPQYVEERQGVHKMITGASLWRSTRSAKVANVMSKATHAVYLEIQADELERKRSSAWSLSAPRTAMITGMGTNDPEAPFLRGRLR